MKMPRFGKQIMHVSTAELDGRFYYEREALRLIARRINEGKVTP